MKKSIFLFFAAILCAMSANAATYLAGTMNGWSSNNSSYEFKGTPLTLNVELPGKTYYEFKIVANGSWKGNSGTIDNSISNWTFDGGDNCKLNTDLPGVYKFVWDNGKLSVTYPEAPAPHDITVRAQVPASWTNTITAWVWTSEDGNGEEVTPTKDGDYYVVTKNAGALYVIFKNGAGWNGDQNQTVDLVYTEDVCLQLNQSGTAKATAAVIDCGAVSKDITVKAVVPGAWENEITAWVWPTGGEGEEVTPTKEGNWYVITKNCIELNVIFKNGTGWNGNENQTANIEGVSENTCYQISALNKDGDGKCTVTEVDCDAVIEPEAKPEPTPTYDYYVAGTFNGWNEKDPAHGMTLDGEVYKATVTLAAGENLVKVTNGTWTGAKGYSAMGAEYEEVSQGASDDNIQIDLTEGKEVVVVYNATTEKVTFEGLTVPTPTYTVTVSAENGSVEGLENEGVYEEDASVTLTATAADGYEFVNWTVAGEEVSTENPYTFVVTADVAVVANFVAVDYKDITFTVGKTGFTGVPQIKWWGAKGLEDAAEPVEMTAGQYSRYSYTFSNIDAITGVSFYIVLDGVQSKTITLHETPNTYSQFYTILQEVFVTLDGEIEGVQLEGHPKAGYSSDYTKVNGVVQLPANTTKAFKLTVDGKDKGGNTIALTKDNLTANFTEDGEGNATIATELAGGYLFTYDYITKDVTVVYPFVGTMDLGQMTPSYDDESVTLEDDNYNEVTIYNVVEGEHTYGENFDIEASVKHNGEWYTLRGKGSWTLADGVMTLVATNLVDENNTVNYTITATALAPQEYTIVCNGTYDEEVTEYYSSIKYIGTTNDTTVTIEIASYGGEPNVLGDINGTYFTIAEYVVEEGEDGVKVLTATATDAAGNTYHITITATKLVYPSVNIYGATATLNEEEGTLTLSAEYKGKTVISEIWGYEGAGEYEWVGLVPTDYSFEWGADIATVTEDGDQYTITGVFMDYTTEEKYEVMITTAKNPATALENVTSTVAPMKAIVNGQLVIVKDGVQYNAQGAVVK